MKRAAIVVLIAIALACGAGIRPSSAQVFASPTGAYSAVKFTNTTPWCVLVSTSVGTQYTGVFRDWKPISPPNVTVPPKGVTNIPIGNYPAIQLQLQVFGNYNASTGACTNLYSNGRTIQETATQPTATAYAAQTGTLMEHFYAYAQFDYTGTIQNPTFNFYFGADQIGGSTAANAFYTPAPKPTVMPMPAFIPNQPPCPDSGNTGGGQFVLSACETGPGGQENVVQTNNGPTYSVESMTFTAPGGSPQTVTGFKATLPNFCNGGGGTVPVQVTMKMQAVNGSGALVGNQIAVKMGTVTERCPVSSAVH